MGLEAFRRDFESADVDAVLRDLAPGFSFYHPIGPEAMTDHALHLRALPLARAALGEDFRFTETLRGEEFDAIHWTASIGGITAEGVDLVKEDANGQLLELRILMRPLQAIQAFAEEMGRQAGGPPSEAPQEG